MWKYVTGCVKETLQRGCNYFDARCGVGFAPNQSTSVVPRKNHPIESFQQKYRCSDNSDTNTKKNEHYWFYPHLLNPWINAFSWSGAIVLGWYSSQLLCLNQKRRRWLENERKGQNYHSIFNNTKALRSVLLSCALAQPPSKHKSRLPVYPVVNNFFNESSSSSVPFINGNQKDVPGVDEVDHHDADLDGAIKDLSGVLSSVENRLALVAIEGGDLREGLAMLHSAAQREHAPALYNLAICYERGLGMKKNDKMAAELYGAAAGLDHPSAMFNLAVFYGQGRGGLPRDPLAAEKLLHLAASKGQQDAIKLLNPKQYQNDNRQDSILKEEFHPQNKTPTETFLDFISGNEIPIRQQQSVIMY